LDWVADLENPKNGKRKNLSKIQCPQCKSEIKIARPKSYIVEAYCGVGRALDRLVLPGIAASLFGTVYAGAWVHGFQSVYLVFGLRDAAEIFNRAQQHRSWLPAYALIPLNLIFARTHYADFVLPGSTLFLVSTQIGDNLEFNTTLWPPLPSTVFAFLPGVRAMYNWCYHHAFCGLNKKWLEEVLPRHAQQVDGQEATDANNQNLPDNMGQGAEVVFEWQVALNANAEGEEAEPAEGDDEAAEQVQPENAHVHQILGNRGDQFVEGTSGIGQMVLGALAFPAVAAGMGGLLTHVLPRTWLSASNSSNGRPGLLSTKWGRSVVGGCLFVVLKDALVLYCRWKLAQGHRSRRILNYDKKTKKYSL
jgi:hypothetical protein